MKVWEPEAEPRPTAEPAPRTPRTAESWLDLILLPLLSVGLTGALIFGAGQVSLPLDEAVVLYGSMIVLYAAVILAVALLLRLRGLRLFQTFLSAGRAWSGWVAIPLGILLALCASGVIELLPEGIQQELMERNEEMMPDTPGQAIALFFVAVLLAPLAEELYFRGHLLRLMARHMSFGVAAVLSALLFSLVHGHLLSPGLGGMVLTLIIFLLGIALAFVARWGGSLRAPFVLHAAYNATLTLPGIYLLLTDAAA